MTVAGGHPAQCSFAPRSMARLAGQRIEWVDMTPRCLRTRNEVQRCSCLIKCPKVSGGFVPLQIFTLGLYCVKRNLLLVEEIVQELQILMLQVAVPCKHKMT